LLHVLNEEPVWRSLLSPKPDARMRDEETILRFFASYFNGSHYRRPMTKFLNDFMYKNRNLKQAEIEKWGELFKATLHTIRDNVDVKNPFAIVGTSTQLNRAVFEAIMVTVAQRIENGQTNFKHFAKKHSELMKDSVFQDSVGTGTSTDKKYLARFERAKHYLG
jgi:hypothetical protein